jgi:serine/threonine protein kinase
MDIFSLGCLLAELFNDGIPLFSYSQLLAYHDNKYEPENALGSISDPRIKVIYFRLLLQLETYLSKDLIAHMVQRDPQQRLDAQGYLLRWSSSGTYSTFLLAKFTISLVVGLSEEISAGFHDYCNTFSAFSLKAEEKIEQLEMLLAPPMPQVLGFCFFFYKSLIRSLPASSTPQGSGTRKSLRSFLTAVFLLPCIA